MKTKKVAKANLPRKTCVVCQRPFTWRKKWRKVWDEVLYCSDACRGPDRRQRRPPCDPAP